MNRVITKGAAIELGVNTGSPDRHDQDLRPIKDRGKASTRRPIGKENAMQDQTADRRKEPRYPMYVSAILRYENSGQSYSAVTMNINAGGLLLRLTESHPFKVGDEVVCELAIADSEGKAFSPWGIGRVVRADPDGTALILEAGVFGLPLNPTA